MNDSPAIRFPAAKFLTSFILNVISLGDKALMDSGKREMTWLVTNDSEKRSQRNMINNEGAANQAKE